MHCIGERGSNIAGQSRQHKQRESTSSAAGAKGFLVTRVHSGSEESKSGEEKTGSSETSSPSTDHSSHLPEPSFQHHKTRDRIRRAKRQHRSVAFSLLLMGCSLCGGKAIANQANCVILRMLGQFRSDIHWSEWSKFRYAESDFCETSMHIQENISRIYRKDISHVGPFYLSSLFVCNHLRTFQDASSVFS